MSDLPVIPHTSEEQIQQMLSSPIYAEMQRLAPGYVPDAQQVFRMIKPIDDPADVAAKLEARMLDVKDDAARYVGPPMEPGDITNGEALRSIRDLSRAFDGRGGADDKQAQFLGYDTLFHIGYREGQKDAETSELDLLVAIYGAFFNRPPDPAGKEFYQGLLDKGVEPWVIVADMLQSPELAKRTGKEITVDWD